MTKYNRFVTIFVVIGFLITFIFQIPAFARDTAQSAYTVSDLNEQALMGLVWMQTSAEYRELCYQAFNLAGMAVEKAVSAVKKGDKPLAVISDLDETLIDNGAYDGGLIQKKVSFSGKTWQEWMQAAQATAIPGAVDFLNAAAQKGVVIFYVTNRDMAGLPGTVKNLSALGFPFADTKHVMVRTDASDKQPRFDAIGREFNVILYMGDNTNDLPIGAYGKDMKERNAIVDQNKDQFGIRFIVLPNPVYGDWERALAPNYQSLTPWGKSEARKAQLRTWTPVP